MYDYIQKKRSKPDYNLMHSNRKRKDENKDACNNFLQKYVQYDSLLSKYTCDLCEKDIGKKIHFLCATCCIDICMDCLSSGKEKGRHIKNHPYLVFNKLNFSLYCNNWTALEEITLIQGIEKLGMDNWDDISDFVSTKSSKECEYHYFAYYYKSKYDSVPNLSQLLCIRNSKGNIKFLKDHLKKSIVLEKKFLLSSKIEENEYGSLNNLNNLDLESKEDATNSIELVGFLPLRGDFNIEFDNDAELLLAEMEFHDEDSENEENIKQKVLSIYNEKLDERIKRKGFVIERNLTDIKKLQTIDNCMNFQEKELLHNLKVYMRLFSPEEFNEIFRKFLTLQKAREIKNELARLLDDKGLNSMDQIRNYIESKILNGKKNKKNKMEISFEYSNPENADEYELCKILKMKYNDFLEIKEKIIKMYNKNPNLKKNEIVKLKKKYDLAHLFLIYEFLATKGILSK